MINKKFFFIIEIIKKISEIKFNVKGAAMLQQLKKNNIKQRMGEIIKTPLTKTILRIWILSYNIFTNEKRPDDAKPCATINIKPPPQPQTLPLRIPPKINPICPTEA